VAGCIFTVLSWIIVTMKQATAAAVRPHRRIGVAEAKARFSKALRDAASGPTIIQSRGRDLAVLLAIDHYEELVADRAHPRGTGAALLGRIDAVKRRHDGGVDDFEPAPMTFRTTIQTS
jgi:prevent-host-death family protein